MLVQLPAMDAVQGLSLTHSLPSLSSFPDPFTILSHLTKPSVLLTFLASLVILSSIRAALLFMRPPPQQKGSVSFVHSVVMGSDKVVASMISPEPSPTSSAVKGKQPEKSATTGTTTTDKKTTSWCWGLLKWDSLPALPTSVRSRINGPPISETERIWQLEQRSRRPGPAFDHPSTFDTILPRSYHISLLCSARALSIGCTSINGENDHVKTCASFCLFILIPAVLSGCSFL